MNESLPVVSIITATYNRSNVLAYAIRSVLWSTFPDWELLVIGDACTDDTEEVVASFDDPRIRFMNLERNIGEQSGPNNEGFRHARGRYIAYLNHDDLWLPDHLEAAVGGIEDAGADLVFTLMLAVNVTEGKTLVGATSTGRYEPYMSVPASSWLLRREVIEEIGPWKFYRECYDAPSQDWLFRAWKAGKELRMVPRMTVVAIQSGRRKGSYAKREFSEHKEYFERMAHEADFREKELTEIVIRYSSRDSRLEVIRWFRRGLFNLFLKSCILVGIHPCSVIAFLRDPRKGAKIDRLRRNRGLEVLKRGGEKRK